MTGPSSEAERSEDLLLKRIPGSIQRSDLGVVFQPIVALNSGLIFAAEALVRCRHPEYANPTRLFECAESERACGRLGRIIRELTFDQGPSCLPLFLNVHPQELSSRWLVQPDDPINFYDSDVYLEITESATLEHFDLCSHVLKEVCSRTGARLVVDDFGAGYSNLRRVIELEPKVIKLDRELVRGIDQSRRLRAMVRWVAGMCQELGARVVAEGIETVAELLAVRDAGVDYAQGFLLARPGQPLPPVNWPSEVAVTRDSSPSSARHPSLPGSARPASEGHALVPPPSRRLYDSRYSEQQPTNSLDLHGVVSATPRSCPATGRAAPSSSAADPNCHQPGPTGTRDAHNLPADAVEKKSPLRRTNPGRASAARGDGPAKLRGPIKPAHADKTRTLGKASSQSKPGSAGKPNSAGKAQR